VLNVTYHNGSCDESITANINDTFPSNFEILDSGGGSVSGNTITWSNIQLTNGTEWNTTIKLKASTDPCDCGHVFTNTLAVDGGNDCCGCPLSGNESIYILVECYNETVFTSSKTASPNPQENCRNITYTTIYNFTNVGALNWSDINFTEQGNNNQTFPDGSTTGNATFTVNDTCSRTRTITLGTPINLGFLDAACGNLTDGTNLSISYTLYQPNTGSFVDWSDLNITGCPSDCSSDISFHEGVRVGVGRSNFSISMIHPNIVDSCGKYNFTIVLTQNSVWNGYNMSITYNGSDFPYINGTANITGITYYNASNQSYDPVPSFEPTKDGDDYTWNFSQNYTIIGSGGRIEFGVIKRCPESANISARLDYEDHCGHSYNDTFSSRPLLINRGDLIITKTPEIVYAYTRNVSWKIYVTNKGDGTAYNVNVTDVLDYDLRYVNSTIDGTYDPSNTTVINNRTVVWNPSDMAPNERHIIDLNATFVGCEFLNNTVNATWGCEAGTCQEVNDTSRVEFPPTRLMIIKHLAGVIDECGDNASFLIEVKNVGETYAYDINVSELLPLGLQYVDGSSTVTGATPSSTDFTGNPLIWEFNQSAGWAPGTDVTITFNVTVTGPCDFTGGDAIAKANYTVPCGKFGVEAANTVTVNKANPHLSITKTPYLTIAENGSTVNWTITITSDGDYEAKNITLKDVLPTNTNYVWSSPAKNSGTGTSGDPLVWNLANMTVGSVTTIHLSANVTGCTEEDTENNATVLWGCCMPKKKSTAITKLRSSPVIELSKDHGYIDTCGGNYTITIRNTGSNASVVGITDVLPEGFVYKDNSSNITSSDSSRTFTNEEPYDLIFGPGGPDSAYDSDGNDVTSKVNRSDNYYASKLGTTSYWVNGTWNTGLPAGAKVRNANFSCEWGTTLGVVGTLYFEHWNGTGWEEMGNKSYTSTPTSDTVDWVDATSFLRDDYQNPKLRCRYSSLLVSVGVRFDYLSLEIETEDIFWNSSNIDTIYTDEAIWLRFGIENAPGACTNAIPSYNNVSFNYTDSCVNVYETNFSQAITPKLANLSIRKEPPTQVVGTAKWTIYVSNTGTGTAYNVTVYDMLGDGYRNDTIEVTYVNGTADNEAVIDSNTITWTGQTIPIGTDVWIRNLSVETNNTGSLDNNVSVYGTCPTGCVYSRDGDIVYAARLNFTKVPDGTLTIGEYANFTITAQFWGPGETYDNTNITDTLPIGFRYLGSNATDDADNSYDANLTSWHAGDYSYYRWYIGNFTGPKIVTINITTVVNDTITNQNGETIINRADEDHKDANGNQYTTYDTARINVTEPDLRITKVANETVVEAGDYVNYTITGNHTSNSTSDAYDVWINDTIPAGLTYVSNYSAPQADIFNQTSQNVSWFYYYISTTTGVTINYTVRVNDDVVVNQHLNNSINLTWTSMNETMGNESYERYGNWTALDDYNRTDQAPLQVNNTVSITKTPDYQRDYTIGESVNYTIFVDLPNATLYNVTVNDTLPAGLIYNSSSFNMSANNDSFSESVSSPNDGTVPVYVNWSLGTVNNSDNTDITITFNAIVADVMANQNGTVISANNVSFCYKDANGIQHNISDESGDITVVEPDLQIAKRYNDTDGIIEAGDYVNYTITANHTSSSTADAYDVWINDTVPEMTIVSYESNPQANQTIQSGNSTSWFYYKIAQGTTVLLNYTVIVNDTVVAGQSLTNNATLTWTSTNGANSYERYGNWTALDDYNGTDNVTLSVNATSSIRKTPDYHRNATIGEELNFTIFIDLPKAYVYNLTVNDTLSDGLIYNESSLNISGNDSAVINDYNHPYINWTLGTVNNSDDEDVWLNFTAIVNDTVLNQDGVNLSNNVTMHWQDYNGLSHTGSDKSANTTIIEPDLTLNKSANASVIEAGDYVNYTITVNHTSSSTADAYDVWINDTVPEGLNIITNESNPQANQTIQSGNNLSWFYYVIARGTIVIINYTVSVNDTVVINESLINNATLTWTSTNGTNPYERFGNWTALDDYNRTDQAPLQVDDTVTISKTPDYPRYATIGESVNYTIFIDLPRAIVYNVTVNDTLPAGLIYNSSSFNMTANNDSFDETVSTPNDGTAPIYVNWTLGTVNNSDNTDITITFTATVADVMANQNGTVISVNNVTFYYKDANGIQHNISDESRAITVVEPDLTLNKTANPTTGQAGDTITYTINVSHTANSTADAYDVWINDTMDEQVDFVAGSNVSDPPANLTVQSGRNISWMYYRIPVEYNKSNPIVLRYNVTLNISVAPGDILMNNASLTWTSTEGNNPHERYGNWTALDDYNGTDDASVNVTMADVSKLPDENRSFSILEEAPFMLCIELSHGTSYNVTVNDTLPEGLIFENDTVEIEPPYTYNITISPPNNGTTQTNISFYLNTIQDGKINISFNTTIADVPNNTNGTIIPPNEVTLYWRDTAGNLHNRTDESGNITVIREPNLNTTDSVRKIVEPDIVLPGATVNYTVYIKNDGFAPAYNVTMSDLLPRYVSYVNGTTIVNGSSGPNPDNITSYPDGTTRIRWTDLIARINASETIWVRYSCNVSYDAPFGSVLVNNATVEKYEDEAGNEFSGANDSAILKIGYPVQVPEYNIFGLLALISLLSVVLAISIRKKGQ